MTETATRRVISKKTWYWAAAQTPPWGPLGYIVYRRTYSRNRPNGTNEEWIDTCRRVVEALMNIPGSFLSEDDGDRLFRYMFLLKGSPAGRPLWQLGTPTVDRLGGNSLNNCWFTIVNSPIKPFSFAFNNMMLGGGVGASVERKYVNELPPVKEGVYVSLAPQGEADFVVPDSREGWVELIEKTFEAFLVTGKSFTYSDHLIRPEGAPIRDFGGVASGPKYLNQGIANLQEIFHRHAGRRLRPVDAMDLLCVLASIIKLGGIRDAALIVMGDYNDVDFLQAKRWDLGNIPNYRSNVNLSVNCPDTRSLPEVFWDGYMGNGEPYGLLNVGLAQEYGRLADPPAPAPDVAGFNPCGEITLEDKEPCNLVEIFLPNIASPQELRDVARVLFLAGKTICLLPYIHEETNFVVKKNMRVGVGVTGVLQAGDKIEWLDGTYAYIGEVDEDLHAKHGTPMSVRRTTVKPSGTLSLLAGVTPGAHPAFARHYIRRVKMASYSPLVDICAAHGHPMEYYRNLDGTYNEKSMVVDFFCKAPEGTKLATDMTAIDQLEVVKYLQKYWSDNSVSVTVYYKLEELPEVRQWLDENYHWAIKSVSFLLHQDHGFAQAPYEEISEQVYEAAMGVIRPITSGNVGRGEDGIDVGECANGSCPVK